MTEQEDRERLKRLFHMRRFYGSAMAAAITLLYSPIGLILVVLRMFLIFHILVISRLLPKSNVSRFILRFMTALCGIIVKVENQENCDKRVKVVVSNIISPADRAIFSLIQANFKVNEWGLPMHLCWIFDLKDVILNLNRQVFIQDVKKICERSKYPLFTQPEGSPTSGKEGLLKFSTWQFSISDSVQPVTLRARRPIPIAMTVIDSGSLGDIFWLLFTPYTVYTYRYLPVMKHEENTTPQEFSEQVQRTIAEALGVEATEFVRHDKYNLIKQLYRKRRAQRQEQVRAQRSGTVLSNPLSPQLEAMVANCKVIVPQVPIDVIRKEILRTKDVDATLSNILEGNIQYDPEPLEEPIQSGTSLIASGSNSLLTAKQTQPLKPSGNQSSATYAADRFATRSDQRHMSLAERKAAMLREARISYIQKHKLPYTIEQIEKRQF